MSICLGHREKSSTLFTHTTFRIYKIFWTHRDLLIKQPNLRCIAQKCIPQLMIIHSRRFHLRVCLHVYISLCKQANRTNTNIRNRRASSTASSFTHSGISKVDENTTYRSRTYRIMHTITLAHTQKMAFIAKMLVFSRICLRRYQYHQMPTLLLICECSQLNAAGIDVVETLKPAADQQK